MKTRINKVLLIAFFISLYGYLDIAADSSSVYICNNNKTKVYHRHKSCRTLTRGKRACRSQITALKESLAKSRGLRPCKARGGCYN
ncbi:MAG: hypothetical protein OEZ36_01615 [Spirochaetota bacterium]|nr:hypothetical protein [Spirochaetota bacterium]